MLEGLHSQVTHILDIEFNRYCAWIFLLRLKCSINIILTGIFFLQCFWGAIFLTNLYIFHWNLLLRDRLPRTKQDGCLLFIQVTSWWAVFVWSKRQKSVLRDSSATKDITRHKSLWQFQDVNNEVDLILAHAALITMPQNVNTLTICPAHPSSLGLGWTRGTERCRVPPEISEHRNFRGKWPKADRGINKNFSHFIMKRTGDVVQVGSGKYFDRMILTLMLIFFTCMQTFWPISDCFRNVQKMQRNFVFIFWRREAAEIVGGETVPSCQWRWRRKRCCNY